jgi:hypothetical protein
MEMLMKHIDARDIMIHLEQLSGMVMQLVQARADNYLLSMIKYLIEKSEIPDCHGRSSLRARSAWQGLATTHFTVGYSRIYHHRWRQKP